MVRQVWMVAVAAIALVSVACGDGDDSSGGSGEGLSADVVSATLGIITTNIDTDTGEGFSDAVEGEELTVGDRVRTDDTGFAEVTYHDGSWMRVESEATLTIEDLVDGDGGQVVSTSIDTGEAWNRVAELSEPEDGFTVDTPVASAAVRGTAFAIDCEGVTSCTFSVVEGEVLVTPEVGDPVTLTAGQSLTVTAGEEPPAPDEPGVDELSADPFIAENLDLDEAKSTETDNGPGDTEGNGGDDGEEGAAGEIDLAAVLAGLSPATGELPPEVRQCVSADAALVSQLQELTERAGDGPSSLEQDQRVAVAVSAIDCGATEQFVSEMISQLAWSRGDCVEATLRSIPPEELARYIVGVSQASALLDCL
jgi:hypothetical protein